ncbi:MAG: PilN domain-containing protein [Gammaproteobacteria bacterium]|nr:PilN domain-containing protein [Gammaproteobacteria bacterium]
MVRQQVNLYQSIFKHQHIVFSFNTLLLVLALVIVAMGGVYAFAIWQKQELNAQLETIQQHTTTIKEQLKVIEARLPSMSANKLLSQQLSQLQEEHLQWLALLGYLNTKLGGNQQGYADVFEGLARQVKNGIWLKRIKVTDGGASFEIAGGTLKPSLVPNLVQLLEREPAFKDVAFQVVQLERSGMERSGDVQGSTKFAGARDGGSHDVQGSVQSPEINFILATSAPDVGKQ